jgi:hypothetical protein
MASDYTIRFRSFLPGAGYDSAGGAKQGKTRVVGRCNVTSYASGGEALAASDVGLSTIDHIDLKVVEPTGDTGGNNERRAIYSPGAAQFYLVLTSQAGVPDEYADAATELLSFVAEGDSAHDVELT